LSFQALNLDPRVLRSIDACGFSTPTDIQQAVIPPALDGRDVAASAQTGTGKTAAFVLPALQRLTQPSRVEGRGPRAVVLTPTRELAAQVEGTIQDLGRHTRARSGTIVGGMPYPPQMRLLREPLDLLVATPGRLMDHMEQGRVDFSRVEILVLDEADRMLDMGFLDAVNTIVASMPAQRQTLLCSATLEGKVSNMANRLLRDPLWIRQAHKNLRPEGIDEHFHLADDVSHKHSLLRHWLADADMNRAVIFTATKRSADTLAKRLTADGHPSAPLHGDMSQAARKRTVEQVRRGRVRFLVATDVAARGLDVKGISHVINFDLPMVAEDYVHRVGRTGRAGASGKAVSLVSPQDRAKLAGIERLTGGKLQRSTVPGLEPRQRTSPGSSRAGKGAGARGPQSGNGSGGKRRQPAPQRSGMGPR